LIERKKSVGVITSRVVTIAIMNGDKDATFDAYYVDYLCVDTMHRKKGIAQQLIQTHHYNQRFMNKHIVVSLFKREEELTGIVPLCVYSTYGFNVTTWTKPISLNPMFTLLEINLQNIHHLFEFIKQNSNQFDITIMTNVSNMMELIKTNNVFVYALLLQDEIIAAYFFRKSCVQIEKGIEVLSCFASICQLGNLELDQTQLESIFIHGFKISFWKIAADHFFGFCAIENISHNSAILQNIQQKTKPIIVSPTAYFFYNFAYPTFTSNKVLILN
jgi:predicted GNAT family acetyltransferase